MFRRFRLFQERAAEIALLRTAIIVMVHTITRIIAAIRVVRDIFTFDIILTATATIRMVMAMTADGLIFIIMILAIAD